MVSKVGFECCLPWLHTIHHSMPLTNDYQLYDIICRACEWTACRLKRVQGHLNLLRISIIREAELLDVDEEQVTTQCNVHNWQWQPILAVVTPIDAKSLWTALPPRPWWQRPMQRQCKQLVPHLMAGQMVYENSSGSKDKFRLVAQ